MADLGLFTLVIGIQMVLDTKNSLVVLGSVVIGILLGEWWQVEEGIRKIGQWLGGSYGFSIAGVFEQSGERFIYRRSRGAF